ncbi:hypothetical protein L0244_39920, partial [bacterium]|nr:hypothetical protein [bacterium]
IYQARVAEITTVGQETPLSSLEEGIVLQLQNNAITDLAIIWERLEPHGADQIWFTLRSLWERGSIRLGLWKNN